MAGGERLTVQAITSQSMMTTTLPVSSLRWQVMKIQLQLGRRKTSVKQKMVAARLRKKTTSRHHDDAVDTDRRLLTLMTSMTRKRTHYHVCHVYSIQGHWKKDKKLASCLVTSLAAPH